jgi:hypothetical protein
MLMDAAYKTNTKRTYSSAQKRYLDFCLKFKLISMPVTEDTLLLYVSFLFEQGLSGSTIRVYLSAVRSLHVLAGRQYPVELLRVKLALKGAVRETPKPIRKMPITIAILKAMLHHVTYRFDNKLITAVMTLAFFGCFRMGELCAPTGAPFQPVSHLCVGDITIDNSTQTLTVFLKQSKTDLANAGVSVYVGCSGDKHCCAFCAMVVYMHFRLSLNVANVDDSPLFVVPGGKPLTKAYMVSVTRLLLSLTGNDPALYSGHSFRAGAATTAGDKQFKEWELKLLGRWSSTAYSLYLRNPRLTSTFASRLVSLD